MNKNHRYRLFIYFHQFESMGWEVKYKKIEPLIESFKSIKEIESFKELIDESVRQAFVIDITNNHVTHLKELKQKDVINEVDRILKDLSNPPTP